MILLEENIKLKMNLQKVIQKLKLDIREISDVPESFSSEVYRLLLANGQRAILKIPYNKSKLFREEKVLRLVKDRLPVAEILDFWEGDEETPGAFLLTELPGQPLSGKVNNQLVYEIGEMLGQFHATPIDQYGSLVKPQVRTKANQWQEWILNDFERFVIGCEQVLEPEFFQKAVDWFEEHFSQLPEPQETCLIHRDYRPGNILAQDGKITGLIDFESSMVGLTSMDFVKMKVFLWDPYPETKEQFLIGYRSIRPLPDLDLTLPFHFFMNAFGGVNWCVVRGEVGGEFYEGNVKQLKEIMGIV